MSHKGYLLVTNISGYTAFVKKNEIEHAQSIVDDLLNTIIESIKSPLIFSKIEGDSIFAHIPEENFTKSQTLLESIELLYCNFTNTKNSMDRNTICSCNACKSINKLDLKLILHYGTYSITTINTQQDLIGIDVMAIRHLSKSPIAEETEINGFLFFTSQCVDTLGISDFSNGLKKYSDTCDDIGVINGYVYDLYPTWQDKSDKDMITVIAEDAWLIVDTYLPVTTALAWEYITEPKNRRLWLNASGVTVDSKENGRIGIGNTYICAHGKYKLDQVIVDWNPFDYLTVDTSLPLKRVQRSTIKLSEQENGTKISWYFEDIKGINIIHTFILRLFSKSLKNNLTNRLKQGNSRIQENIKNNEGQDNTKLN